MLRLSRGQLDALQASETDAFLGRMANQIRTQFPGKTQNIAEPEILRILALGLDSARSYGLKRECDVEGYLNFMFFYSFDFNRSLSWARDTLLDPSIPAERKIDILYARSQEETD